MKWIAKLSLPVAMIACAGVAFAQSTATLSGTVKDPSGAVLPGATITVVAAATGAQRVVTSDSAGNYVVPSLQPGTYTVQAQAPGFGLFTVKSLVLQVDQAAALNISLSVASAGETIDVADGAPVIDAGSITVGQVIDKQTVQEIPLNGRHFLDLTVLTPGGVTPPATGSLTAPSRGLGANSFVTAGNREDSVNFQINGVNLNDMVQNQITFQPSINTTSEFKINNSTYSAEYGRSSGSIVNVSTRSGTNQFHGEAFDYVRNNSFDTRNFFNPRGQPQAALKRNNFGASVGGPIWKDKTFFFGSYEALRQHQGLNLTATVLKAADRAGVTDPVSKALLAYIPVGNTGDGTYFSIANGPVQTDQGTIDILHNFSSADILHGFYAIQKDNRTEPNLQGNTVGNFGDHRTATRQILTLNETHVFSSRFVNEARLGFNRIAIVFSPNNTVDPSTVGFNNYPAGVTAPGGLPQTTISGYSLNFGGPSGFPQGRYDTLGLFSDTATYTVGKHSVKIGGEYRRFINANFSNDVGSLSFVATPAIVKNGVTIQPARTALQNFQVGQAGTFAITPNAITSRLYSNSVAGFVVDSYKLTPSLTIEAGFRFEWNGTPIFGANKAVLFDTASVSLYPLGTSGFNSAYKQNYNYEPRVGFTYDVFGTGKTVLRGGYAIMADQPETNLISGLASNPPLTSRVSYTASTTASSAPLTTIPVESLFSSALASAISVTSVDPKYHNAYTETYNLNLQHELPWQVGLSVGYYGSVGMHLRQGVNINEINPSTGTRPYLKLAASSPIDPNVSINTNITQATGNGYSNYNAMWLTARKNTTHGLTFSATWNYTKSMDLGSLAGTQFTDIFQPRLNYGLSDFDVRHRIAGNAIYDLPFKGNRLVSGFRVSGILQFQTGNPLNITTTSTYTGTSGVQRPNLIAPIPYNKNYRADGLVNWFTNPTSLVCSQANTTAGCVFQIPTTGFGNFSRNAGRGPGFTNLDLSLEKNTKLFERLTFQARIDAFDALNHPSFSNPGTSAVAGSGSFGVITATRFPVADLGSSRQLQIAGKFIF
jgi:hypothetical protein